MKETGYKIRNQKAIYYITFTIVYWIGLFTRPIYIEILLENLRYYQKERGLIIYAWVIMSNHIHLIVKSGCSGNAARISRARFHIHIEAGTGPYNKNIDPINLLNTEIE